MNKKILNLENKLINQLLINGKKTTSEKILLHSFKELQKYSNKHSKKLIQLSIINNISIFKLHKLKNKKQKRNKKVKEIPTFISSKTARNSLAIKFILKNIEIKKSTTFYSKLTQEIYLSAQSKNKSIEKKNELQKQVILKKHFLKYYKW